MSVTKAEYSVHRADINLVFNSRGNLLGDVEILILGELHELGGTIGVSRRGVVPDEVVNNVALGSSALGYSPRDVIAGVVRGEADDNIPTSHEEPLAKAEGY